MTKTKKFEPIQLGDRVKDPISGYQGIAVAITQWLHGCIRVGVQAEKLNKGELDNPLNFDQAALVVLKKAVHKPVIMDVKAAPPAPTRRSTGGPAREGGSFRRTC